MTDVTIWEARTRPVDDGYLAVVSDETGKEVWRSIDSISALVDAQHMAESYVHMLHRRDEIVDDLALTRKDKLPVELSEVFGLLEDEKATRSAAAAEIRRLEALERTLVSDANRPHVEMRFYEGSSTYTLAVQTLGTYEEPITDQTDLFGDGPANEITATHELLTGELAAYKTIKKAAKAIGVTQKKLKARCLELNIVIADHLGSALAKHGDKPLAAEEAKNGEIVRSVFDDDSELIAERRNYVVDQLTSVRSFREAARQLGVTQKELHVTCDELGITASEYFD